MLLSVRIKNQMRFILFFSLSICFLTTPISAQDESVDSIDQNILIKYVDFSLTPGFPTSTFKDKLDRKMFGCSFTFLKQRDISQMGLLGVQMAYQHLGAVSRIYTDFEVRTGTNLWNLKMMYRYYPDFFFWRIEPFIEAGFGPQIMYSLTTTTFFTDGASDFMFDETNLGLTYMAGFGFTTYLSDGFLFLTKFNIHSSTNMTYLAPREYSSGLPIDNFDLERSAINYFDLHIGISYVF